MNADCPLVQKPSLSILFSCVLVLSSKETQLINLLCQAALLVTIKCSMKSSRAFLQWLRCTGLGGRRGESNWKRAGRTLDMPWRRRKDSGVLTRARQGRGLIFSGSSAVLLAISGSLVCVWVTEWLLLCPGRWTHSTEGEVYQSLCHILIFVLAHEIWVTGGRQTMKLAISFEQCNLSLQQRCPILLLEDHSPAKFSSSPN